MSCDHNREFFGRHALVQRGGGFGGIIPKAMPFVVDMGISYIIQSIITLIRSIDAMGSMTPQERREFIKNTARKMVSMNSLIAAPFKAAAVNTILRKMTATRENIVRKVASKISPTTTTAGQGARRKYRV